jgi:hypothetical protein
MAKVLPPPAPAEVSLPVLLRSFDEQILVMIVKNLQDYEYELKRRRKGKILFIPLKACDGLKVAIYEWGRVREIADRLRQLRNRPEVEQAPYKHLITLVTEAQYALAEIFADATTEYSGKEFFQSEPSKRRSSSK